jgi:hypothetical protein
MTNNKQQTAVEFYLDKVFDIIGNAILDKLSIEQINKIHDLSIQAKEIDKERTINFTEDWYFNGPLLGVGIDVKSTIEQHFNNTYGGGEQ